MTSNQSVRVIHYTFPGRHISPIGVLICYMPLVYIYTTYTTI